MQPTPKKAEKRGGGYVVKSSNVPPMFPQFPHFKKH
jgi:hypothetical protein